ncbi:hypothetical protein ACU611_08490 [Klebsiella aerogenes]|uniref:hypothetical protein n=1 Tax=Enterobacteriaceae TaxID=543 RepID=UPI000F81EFAF|nr:MULTISPECIES: hypothetical protein [Enterobacteriaceae]MBT2090678.1 hypothetical protein [Enterobacter bugandensis]RTQ02460.1 hypothetical protein EKN38_07955 [Enterobacter sp. WCHEn045836]
MLISYSHTKVNALEWNNFICQHSSTPYPQSTYNGEYSMACYGYTPTYVSIDIQGACLRCLVLINENTGTVKWSCGPVISGAYQQIPLLVKKFFEWLSSLNLSINKASFTADDTFETLSLCNHLCYYAQELSLKISLSTLIKKDLTTDLWLDAVYYSGGKKRKIKHIIDRVKRDNVDIITCSENMVYARDELYRVHYLNAIQQGYERNKIYDQSALNAIESIILQDNAGISRSFFTVIDGVILSCLNIVILGSECYLRKLAINHRSNYKDPGSSYYAMMAAAEWAKSQGLSTFNLSIARLSEEPKTSRLRQYKSRFGKKIVPLYELKSDK